MKSVRFLNRDDAYNDAIKKFPQYKDVAGKDAFPASFIVKLDNPEQHKEFDEAMSWPARRAQRAQPEGPDRPAVRGARRAEQRRVRRGVGAGDRRNAVDRQHGSSRGLHPAHRNRHHATGRRQSVVHPVAVPRGGDAGRVHRRGHLDHRPDPGSGVVPGERAEPVLSSQSDRHGSTTPTSSTSRRSCCSSAWGWRVSRPMSRCACTSGGSHGQEAEPGQVRQATRSWRPTAKRGTTTRSSTPTRPGSRWWAPR